MYNYLEDILAEASDDFDGKDVTPAVSNLFQVNEACQKLNMITADLFHRIVARLLYVATRARLDLQIALVFLCKQVKCLNVDNWKKLGRLVQYVRVTIHLPLILESDGSENMIWSIDASFAVHIDMRSHIGYCLTLGTGCTISGLLGQKVNIRSSTESELVGIDGLRC